MEVILSHFSAAELRAKCTTALNEEMKRAVTQLGSALDSLTRALSVVEASRTTCRAESHFGSESTQNLVQLRARSTEIASKVHELEQKIGTPREEENTIQKVETALGEEDNCTNNGTPSDEENKDDAVVKNEPIKSESDCEIIEITETNVKTELWTNSIRSTTTYELQQSSEDEVEILAPSQSSEDEVEILHVESSQSIEDADSASDGENSVTSEEQVEEIQSSLVSSSKKRKASEASFARDLTPLKRAARGILSRLRKRVKGTGTDDSSTSLRFAMNAAIELEENQDLSRKDSLLNTFLHSTARAGEMLVKKLGLDYVSVKDQLKDTRLLLSVATANLKSPLRDREVYAAWEMLEVMRPLYDICQDWANAISWHCLELRKHLLKEYIVPSEVISSWKTRVCDVLESFDEWDFHDDFSVTQFDSQLHFINEFLEGRYESWNPRSDPQLGKLVARVETITSFQAGGEWNDRYGSICRACSKMSASTFVWTVDLESELPAETSLSAVGEEGFKDSRRVENDFHYVTSYEEQVRNTCGAAEKLSAFDELVDRVQWLFTAVLLTHNQSLVSIDRLTRLNQCIDTLVDLCDDGNSLNLEGCIHLEKLIFTIRRLMYMRMSYAIVSKPVPIVLLQLLPSEGRPEFVYPPWPNV